MLLRPSSYKSTMIQMVGRGLRTVDPEEYPGIVKTDCIVLDFGTSSLMHGSLEQEVDLDGHPTNGIAPTKDVPGMRGRGPAGHHRMPAVRLCVGAWTQSPEVLDDFIMTEIDLLKRSNFRWVDLFGCDDALMATGSTPGAASSSSTAAGTPSAAPRITTRSCSRSASARSAWRRPMTG